MKRATFCKIALFIGTHTFTQVDAMEIQKTSSTLQQEPEVLLKRELETLLPIHEKLSSLATYSQKLEYISGLSHVQQFFKQNAELESSLKELPLESQYLVKAIVAIHQGPVIFSGYKGEALSPFVEQIEPTERFYSYMGGVVGYHVKTLKLMCDQLEKKQDAEAVTIHAPPFTDIREDSRERRKMVREGVDTFAAMAEVYVVGGAGDRLNLLDDKTKQPLPVARLEFAGHSLLENLVRDLQAREFFTYKVTGSQYITPIVLMTSKEKQNDMHIARLLEERKYFGRPTESIFRIKQPMTPVIAVDGLWAVSQPLELILKPGGHGVIWKLCDEYGAFSFLEKQKREYVLVRQINNPLAGLDINLFALAGFGKKHDMAFGFESVPRIPGMSEGMNVLKEYSDKQKAISNLEYTEFAKAKASSPDFARIADTAEFPANTNILYASIEEVKEASKKLPLPGFLVNMKHPVETLRDGMRVPRNGARLESTMQNIADVITSDGDLSTFVLLNSRDKTMSVTKKAFDGKSLAETPEGCFYDLMKENVALLRTVCNFEIAPFNSAEDYIANGPNAMFSYHPALGPHYSVIGQKIKGGKLCHNAELEIEASEVSIEDLTVDGSLRIIAENVMGNLVDDKLLFSNLVGRAVFDTVEVKNQGIDRSSKNSCHKAQITRKESCTITLVGNSEVVAKNVKIEGNFELVVEDGTRAILTQAKDGRVQVSVEKLGGNALSWSYAFDADDNIVLKK